MKLIVLVLGLCLCGVSSLAAMQTCPTQPGLNKDTDLEYLQKSKGHTAGNEVCIERLLRYLSYYKDDPRTLPILINYLDLPSAGPAIAVYHAQTPEVDRFPAIYSLVMIGKSADPELINLLLYGRPNSLQESNALQAYMDVYEPDPLAGIKNLDFHEGSEKPEIRERRHVLAGRAAALCRIDVRQQCLSTVSGLK